MDTETGLGVLFLTNVATLIWVACVYDHKNETIKELRSTLSLFADPIFRADISPWEIITYYGTLFKLADKKAREFTAAYYALAYKLESQEKMHGFRATWASMSEMFQYHLKNGVFTIDWQAKDAIPIITLKDIHKDAERFKTAISTATKNL